MGTYRVAQICWNGHCITDSANANPELCADFCRKCGAKTTTYCPLCKEYIRGEYYVPEVLLLGARKFRAPAYCHKCGAAYPWTQASLDAAKTLILEDENTTQEEQNKLIEVLPALLVDSPNSQLAESRLKRFLSKAGPFIAEGIRDIIVGIAAETIKKSMGL